MSTLPREQRFEIDAHVASLLIAGQTVFINETQYIVNHIALKKGGYDRILVATRIPSLKLTEVEKD